MKIKDKVILPISYFGPVQYYRLAHHYQSFIEACENFQKRSIRNRTTILSPNGPQHLSIPLVKGKTTLPISEVKIAYHHDWQVQHLRSIKTAYGSAPYFEFYIDVIESILMTNYTHLFDFNMATTKWICDCLNINLPAYTTIYTREVEVTTIDWRKQSVDWQAPILKYNQVFEPKFGFVNGLSILDLIFNLGPEGSVIVKA